MLLLTCSAAERVFTDAEEYEQAIKSISPGDDYVLIESGESDESEEDRRQSVAGGDSVSSVSEALQAIAVQSAATSPTYPDWDLSLIDLNTIPNDIYNIINSDNRLIVIQVWSAKYRIFVLRNGYIYSYYKIRSDNTGSVKYNTSKFFGFGTRSWSTDDAWLSSYMADSCLYSAIYNYDGSLASDWQSYSKSDITATFVGSSRVGNYKLYTGELSSDTCDFYQIGNSHMAHSFNYIVNSQTVGGSTSGDYIISTVMADNIRSSWLSDQYLSTDKLTFPTFESQSTETQKGIFATLKDLPGKILDGLKSLFVPPEGFYDQFASDLQDALEDHLGILYAAPDQIIRTLESIARYQPGSWDDEDCYITFPALKYCYYDDQSDTMQWVQITQPVNYTFEWLADPPYSTLYTAYRAFVWLILFVGFLNLCIRKFSNITLGGAT